MKDTSREQQNVLNALAVFSQYSLPPPRSLTLRVDRTWWAREEPFIERLFQLMPEHFENWSFNKNHGPYAIRGWRERVGTCSMQIVEHSYGVMEVDFDLYNPNFGLLPLLGHLVEVLTPGTTDPFRVMRGLRKRGVEVLDAREEVK